MRRREFIALFGGAAAAWPLAARAQRGGKLPTIGFLGAATPAAWSQWVMAFVQRLRELGWIEGHTIAIEYRWGEGRNERFGKLIAEFVERKVDVIYVGGTAASVAAMQATPTIPIVFALVGDPVGAGLVSSLARPGGNITGLSIQTSDVANKRVGLLREIIPNLRRLAIMANPANPANQLDIRQVQAAADTVGLEVTKFELRRAEDVASALKHAAGRAQALYVCADPLFNAIRAQLNVLALEARLPTMYALKEYLEFGGLMSYGPDIPHSFRRAADYIDKILRGAKPGDLPVEQPTKFEMVINVRTANAIGVSVPLTLLARADEVIE
jgi:putative ABC transport system substrate-binding protein